LGLPGDEGRAPLHRDAASDRPQSGDQPQGGEQAECEQRCRGKRIAHPVSHPRMSGRSARMTDALPAMRGCFNRMSAPVAAPRLPMGARLWKSRAWWKFDGCIDLVDTNATTGRI